MIRMVLAVREHLQITNMIILDNFDLQNCLKNSILGDVPAQVLKEPVGGSHQDCYGRTNLNGIFADWNFTNKGFKDNPCGHFGILTMSLSHHFINDIIDKEFEEV